MSCQAWHLSTSYSMSCQAWHACFVPWPPSGPKTSSPLLSRRARSTHFGAIHNGTQLLRSTQPLTCFSVLRASFGKLAAWEHSSIQRSVVGVGQLAQAVIGCHVCTSEDSLSENPHPMQFGHTMPDRHCEPPAPLLYEPPDTAVCIHHRTHPHYGTCSMQGTRSMPSRALC